MYLGIDHLVIAVADPDEAVAAFERAVGRAPTGGGRHEALGTFNRVVWLGDSYLEFIGVFDPASRGGVVGRRARPARARDRRRLRDMGDRDRRSRWRPGVPAAGRFGARRGADRASGGATDGAVVRWRLAAPEPLGPDEPPFLIEHDVTAAEWTPADRTARAAEAERLGGPLALEVLELPVDDPNAASQRLLRARRPPVPAVAGGRRRARRERRASDRPAATATRWRCRRRPSGSAPASAEGRSIELFGCRWVIVPASLTVRPETQGALGRARDMERLDAPRSAPTLSASGNGSSPELRSARRARGRRLRQAVGAAAGDLDVAVR